MLTIDNMFVISRQMLDKDALDQTVTFLKPRETNKPEFKLNFNVFSGGGLTLNGFKVVPTAHIEPVPKIKLSDDFPWCTPAFREETNLWFKERFGMKHVGYKVGNNLLMHPDAYHELLKIK